MLTRMRREVLNAGLIMLVLLTLAGFYPFLTNDFANAEETVKMVDNEINYVNSEEAIIPDEEEESYINKEDQEVSEEENDEKTEKKSSKKEVDEENTDEINEDNEDTDQEEPGETDPEEESEVDQEEISEADQIEVSETDLEEASDTDEEEEDSIYEEDIDAEEECDIESMASNDEDNDSENEKKKDNNSAELYSEDNESDNNKGNEDENDFDGEDTETDTFNGDFPESYSDSLAELKEAHPTWNFVPADTGVTWKEALDAEDKGTTNFVDPSVDSDQRERSDKTYDGRWYLANRKTIAHYMDPRNFLNEEDIFQFLVQNYEEGAQTTETVEDIIDGSFMEDGNPGGDYDSYAECIADAGAEADVNPNVLAAMIIMEQGWDGSSLVSGKKDGYKGYYNFYNIGAWTTDSMSSTERGLWYAKGEGEKKTSYGRPWKSPYKAIEGGAEFYHENYISNHQNTYYTKKFNVMNGEDEIGDHQYMTNVSGALDEGKLVKRAYQDNKDLSLTFEIPIYDNMPKKVCRLP